MFIGLPAAEIERFLQVALIQEMIDPFPFIFHDPAKYLIEATPLLTMLEFIRQTSQAPDQFGEVLAIDGDRPSQAEIPSTTRDARRHRGTWNQDRACACNRGVS